MIKIDPIYFRKKKKKNKIVDYILFDCSSIGIIQNICLIAQRLFYPI